MTTTAEPTRPDLAPWAARLPEHLRDQVAAGRRAAETAAALTDDDIDAQARAAADDARAELLTARARQRWAMWCRQVPARYADPRAHHQRHGRQPFDWWLSRLDAPQHPDRIAAWLRSDSHTLVLFGSTGTGKTLAAIAAGYAAADAAVHTRYSSQLDYLLQLRPGGSDDPYRVRWNAANTSLLILDDLGAETEEATQFVRQEMCALLDARLREGRRQIVTTNESPAALADTFGDRIMSRLRDGAVVLKLGGGDRRELAREPW